MSLKKLLYFSDPMCSWCWGFSPTMRQIVNRFSDRVAVEFFVGGLRAGNREVMDQQQRSYILGHWQNVHRATGQVFDFNFKMPNGFVYDTEPACRAIKTFESINASQTLDYIEAIQQSFYVDHVDVTQAENLANIASSLGIDSAQFLTRFESKSIKQITQDNFLITSEYGIAGFPTLLGQDPNQTVMFTQGFRPYEMLQPLLSDWLDG